MSTYNFTLCLLPGHIYYIVLTGTESIDLCDRQVNTLPTLYVPINLPSIFAFVFTKLVTVSPATPYITYL